MLCEADVLEKVGIFLVAYANVSFDSERLNLSARTARLFDFLGEEENSLLFPTCACRFSSAANKKAIRSPTGANRFLCRLLNLDATDYFINSFII